MPYPQYEFQHSVLVISDLAKSEAMVRRGLLSYPVQFEFCENEAGLALKKIEEAKPDFLLVSLDFQNSSVLDFAKQTHEKWSQMPAVFLTESHLLEQQKQILKLGAFDIAPLPQNENETKDLLRKLDRAVRYKRKLKTRLESFIELHEQSRNSGRLFAEVLDENNELSAD